MDDRKLEVMLVAVEEGSLSKAAAKCHCSQSAVTQLVNAAEAELGCKVLTRSHAGVELSDAGQVLLPAMREAHESLARLASAASNLVDASSLVRIGVYPSIVKTWLPGAISAFERQEARASFDIRIGSDDLAELLKDGQVDMLLCDDWLLEESFPRIGSTDYRSKQCQPAAQLEKWTPLVDDPFFAVVPAGLGYRAGQTIRRQELFEHPYIFDRKYVFARYLSSEVSSIVSVSSDDTGSILAMVASGMGVAVLPELSLGNVPDGVVVLGLDPPGKRILGALLPADATALARAFTHFLSERELRE